MKKTILVASAILLGFLQLNAQDLDNQILLSLQRPIDNSALIQKYNNGPNFNLTFIQSNKPNQAWRLGLGIRSAEVNRSEFSQYIMNDTLFSPVLSSLAYTPFLFVGHEARKYLHKDVFLFTALDLGLGAGGSRVSSYTKKESVSTGENYGTWIERGVTQGEFSLYSFARPQIGGRIAWGNFLASYTLGVSMEILSDFGSLDVNTSLKHEFGIGFRFNRKEDAKRKFLMFKY